MSTQSSDNNKRIAKNTLLLYFRMLFMMVVSLYTSRVILEDFGIYNVVGGVVAIQLLLSLIIAVLQFSIVTFVFNLIYYCTWKMSVFCQYLY